MKPQSISRWARSSLAGALALLVAACGDSGSAPAPTPTVTRTHTPVPTVTPTHAAAAAVNGLVVVRDDVGSGAREPLGAPPPVWMMQPDGTSFDRAFANADWQVVGTDLHGTTTPDGQFAISGLPPGRYTLEVSKTLNGNLVPLSIPFTVGDDGSANVVAEVGLGLLRTAATYMQGGTHFEEIRGPYGNWLITRDGQIAELGDPSRVLTDANGDGKFDSGPCTVNHLACDADHACPGRLACECIPSCPACDNCGLPGICQIATLPHPTYNVYRCAADGSCAQQSDTCVCVPSCPDCNDCLLSVCVPSCTPVEISSLTVTAPTQLVVGRQAQATATALLSDGTAMDVTYLATWLSSDTTVASIDSWGTVSALAIGSTELTATLATVTSAAATLEVVARPTLVQITVQNQNCQCGPIYNSAPMANAPIPPCLLPAGMARTDLLPVPRCSQVVQIGGTLQFTALGQFADGSYADITKDVQWQLAPPEVGNVVTGLFTAVQAGTTELSAGLDGVVSDTTEIKVVTQPTLDSLSIYADNTVVAGSGGSVRGGPAIPCAVTDASGMSSGPCCCMADPNGAPTPCDCGYAITVLRGDQLQFHATAHYDTGEWRDVTSQVTWRSSDATVATVDTAGVMQAVDGGEAKIDASLDAVTSDQVGVRVVNEATLQSLYVYQEGNDRVVAKGDQRFFHATGYYDIGISRDVTADATWHSSDESVGGFDSPGVFTGRAAGTVQVWAELSGQQSAPQSIEVFETSELAYCDPNNINRADWSDAFNRVILESDCATYTEPGVATLRYTVTEIQPHGGVFNPCLDLFVYNGDTRIRTIREEGCGDPFLAAGAPNRADAALEYQLRAFWDLKDDSGTPVPSGTYIIYGRFYLYYDPVVKLVVTVTGSGGPVPTPTPSGPTAVTMQIDSVTGTAGASVSFGVSLKATGIAVAGVQNDIVFDTRLPIDARDNGRPSCTVNAMIDKPQSAFSFLPAGCSPGKDCDGVRALILSTDNVDAIPDGAVLYTCTATVPTDAAGLYPLRCAGAVASDPNGAQIPVRCLDGAIKIASMVPPPGPPPEPSPQSEGACFIGSSTCAGSSYFSTAQAKCCEIFRFSAMPGAISWCPATALGANGGCMACASSPCDGLVMTQ